MSRPTRTKAAPSNQQGSHRAQGLPKSQAYDRLKAPIVTGVYPPGTFLWERRPVDELGMSKSPIRAALERLEGEDYVRVSPRQGIVVREPSLCEIADQFEIRLAWERHVLESLARKPAPAQVTRLRDNLRHQRQAAEREELDGLNAPNAYGHRPLIDNDPTRPDVKDGPQNDYWDHVDYIVEQAKARGLFIGFLPTWGDKWNKKWAWAAVRSRRKARAATASGWAAATRIGRSSGFWAVTGRSKRTSAAPSSGRWPSAWPRVTAGRT